MGCNASVQPVPPPVQVAVERNDPLPKPKASPKPKPQTSIEVTPKPKEKQDNPQQHGEEAVLVVDGNVKHCKSTINNYDVYYPPLGSGATSTVYYCRDHNSHKEFAIKSIDRKAFNRLTDGLENMESAESLCREIAILKKIDHPYIIKLYEVIDDKDDDCLHLVFDYIQGAAIAYTHNNNTYNESQLLKYIRQLLQGVDYLHHNNIIHRDIKVENLLLDTKRDVLFLCDFGLSHICKDNDLLCTVTGTRYYQAPEILKRPLKPFSGKKADMYAIGVVLFRLLFGSLPYKGYNTQVTTSLVLKGMLLFPYRVNPDLSNFIRRLLCVDPNKRLSVEEALQHPWITENGKEHFKLQSDVENDVPLIERVTSEDQLNAMTPIALSFYTVGYIKLKAHNRIRRVRDAIEKSKQQRLTMRCNGVGQIGDNGGVYSLDQTQKERTMSFTKPNYANYTGADVVPIDDIPKDQFRSQIQIPRQISNKAENNDTSIK